MTSPMTINVLRDREGELEPWLLPKRVRRFTGFDDKVISLIYHTEISKNLVSTIIDGVIDEVMT